MRLTRLSGRIKDILTRTEVRFCVRVIAGGAFMWLVFCIAISVRIWVEYGI